MQSSSQIITNIKLIPIFTAQMPFLSPNQQCESTEGKGITLHGLDHCKLTWGHPSLSLTTKSSWLPWERVVKPLVSPLMLVPQHQSFTYLIIILVYKAAIYEYHNFNSGLACYCYSFICNHFFKLNNKNAKKSTACLTTLT